MKRKTVIKTKIIKVTYLPKYANATTTNSGFNYNVRVYDLDKSMEVDGEYKY